MSGAAAARAPDDHLRGVLLVGASAVMWSTGGLIVRSLETVDPWTIIFWRSLTAALFLLGYLLVRDRRNTLQLFRDMGIPGLLVALSFVGASVGFVVALDLASVAQTLVTMSSAPLIAAVLGRVVLGERIRPASYVAIAGVMLGIILMMASDLGRGRSFAGALVALAVAFSLAGAIVTTRRHPHIRMVPAGCTGAAMAFAISIPLASPLSVGAHDFELLVFFGAIQLGGGLILFLAGTRLIPAAQSALIGMLEPILGPAWVWLFLSEQPRPMTLVGGLLVIASVAFNTIAGLRGARR